METGADFLLRSRPSTENGVRESGERPRTLRHCLQRPRVLGKKERLLRQTEALRITDIPQGEFDAHGRQERFIGSQSDGSPTISRGDRLCPRPARRNGHRLVRRLVHQCHGLRASGSPGGMSVLPACNGSNMQSSRRVRRHQASRRCAAQAR